MIVRKATTSDLHAIIDLAADASVYSQSPFRDTSLENIKAFRTKDLGQLENAFGQPHLGLFVAEEGGEIVGHVIVVAGNIESSTGEEQAWIVDLSVKQAFWGTAAARELAARAEEFARLKGLRYLGLGVTSSNERAVRFYEKMGFVEERKRMIKKIT